MLFAQQEKRIAKYRRNFNRYANNGQRTEDIREQYSNPLAYWNTAAGEDTGVIPSLNVIKSCIDTHVSKLSQTKVRPFFNPIVGTFQTRKTCRQAQVYFDEFFDAQKVYPKAAQILRFADIFECGHLWVDDESKSIRIVGPWEWYIDAAEYYFGELTRGFLRFHQYPLIRLKDKLKPGDWKNRLNETPWTKVTYYVYFDLLGARRVELFGDSGEIFHTKKIDYDVPPVVTLYREKPLKGAFSTSMADDVYTIQRQIDTLCHRISMATELSPANAIFLPKGSDLKASVITNEIGQMYEFTPTPTEGGGRPVVATPRPIDPSYTALLEMWIEKAYNVTGVSQLSAQVKKPKGLDSGVALQTVEDVESERHQVSLQDYIQLFKDLAETCIAVFPEKEDILPSQTGRAKIKWGEIKRQRKAFSIQFSASSSLSKDPQTKMEQIEKLIEMGVINPDLAASLLEFPDLENAYSITASSYDDCQRIIERAVENDNYKFPDVVNIKQLFAESVNTLLRLDANDEKPEVLERLKKLIAIVKARMDEIAASEAPPPPPPAPPMPPVPEMAPGMAPVPPGMPPGMPPAPVAPPIPAPGPVETGVAMAGPPPGAVM